MDKKDFGFFKSLYCAALFSSTFICASSVLAAGFQIQEQNVTNLGTAYSGTAALSADASTNFYNAAGLTHIPHTQIVVSAVGINGKFDLHPTRATTTAGPDITPLHSENAGGLNFVPGLHMAHRFSEDIVVGMSVTSAFGLKTEYDDTSVARYIATRSELITVLFSPSIAYQMNPHWSFAVGPDIQYAKANLDASLGTNSTVFPDGFSKNEGDDWGYSFHAGLLYEWTEKTRVGLSYRSHFNYDVEGNSQQMRPVNLLGTGVVNNVPVETRIVLPETAILSAFHEFENNWAIMADVHWTAWSRFRTLRLRYPNGVGTETDTWEHWKDTIRYAVGAQYRWCDKWIFRAGVALDETPVPEERRTARIPDSDRTWLGIGIGYTFTPNFHIDVGYAHLFFKDANLLDRGPFAKQTATPASNARLEGKYESYANIFGIQVKIDFV